VTLNTYSDRTLSNRRYTIILHSVVLSNAVPVDTSTIGSQSVSDMNLYGIPLRLVSDILGTSALTQAYPVCFNCRARGGSVYGQDHALKPIWCSCDVCDLEPVLRWLA
jgi:hypothetical protein